MSIRPPAAAGTDPTTAIATHNSDTTSHGQTTAGRALLTGANAAAQRSSLSLVPGTDVQVYSALLAALAGLSPANNKMMYWTGSSTVSLADLTSFARTLLDDADAATMLATLGAAPLNSPAMTGTPTVPTPTAGANNTQAANTTWVQSLIATYAEVAIGRAKSAAGTPVTYLTIPGMDVQGYNTTTPGASTIQYGMIKVDTTVVLDQLACEVTTTGSSGQTARMGIVAANTNWQPTGSLLVDSGTVAVNTSGAKIVTISDLTLTPGRYLTAIYTDSSAATFRSLRGGAQFAGIDPALGSSSLLTGMRVSQTYGALPTTMPSWDTPVLGTGPLTQIVYVRIKTP